MFDDNPLFIAIAVAALIGLMWVLRAPGREREKRPKARPVRGLPDLDGTVMKLRFERGQCARLMGVAARFGCGHVMPIQIMGTQGALVRNVLARESDRFYCHGCWFRTGESTMPYAGDHGEAVRRAVNAAGDTRDLGKPSPGHDCDLDCDDH